MGTFKHSPIIAGAAGLAALLGAPAMAQDGDRPVLTVYTYESFVPEWGPGPKIEAAFEAVCACDLQFEGLADGVAILNRLKLEGASSPADLVIGLTTDLVPEAKATGLFADSGTDLSNLSLPVDYADPVFVPFDYSYLAVMVDTEEAGDWPKSLDALVTGDSEQKIALQDPRTSTPGLGFLLWMKAVYGDEAKARWEELSDRILTVTPGWSEAYGLFTSGEVPLVMSYSTSPAYHIIEDDTRRYQAAAFSDGQYLQIEVAGMVKSTDTPELARSFLAFILTHEFQSIIPTGNWAYPVIDGIDLPEAFEALIPVENPIYIDPETVAENRQAWTQEWLEALGR
ncbi:thiamine ABC transporter substrate binding subunit [Fulvimarina sp. 2208YS6-2-32]|uniref:Thiamine ABC transporter substrate binding subunit n=1 Tax=Fulvimarina uroteuthidis TaxID=3098149 RepID=A0ABU5I6N0_9HYPH|nr:thiamine ABC transporter substrate binding subunit [Fulvimarina sp. 2208YS6-2-32]MDY8111022.1 thiamine ABC transporter substrate binding subunit [Fulvimarina sp. 2208YS6-2-32]